MLHYCKRKINYGSNEYKNRDGNFLKRTVLGIVRTGTEKVIVRHRSNTTL